MFIRYNSEPNIQPYKKKASTAFSKNSLVAFDTNGFLVPATASSTINGLVGVILQDIASGDADYASATMVPVDVPRRLEDQFVADNVVTSAAQTDVGEACELVDSLTIDVGNVTNNPLVRVEKVITASKVVVSLLGAIS